MKKIYKSKKEDKSYKTIDYKARKQYEVHEKHLLSYLQLECPHILPTGDHLDNFKEWREACKQS